MPLTISHPAVAIPLSRLNLPLSALVIGSMAPDIPYFIPFLFSQSGFSHSIIGVFVFCLPLGLISLGIFHLLVKTPALSLLPPAHQSRLHTVASNFTFLPVSRFLLIAVSIILGAFTHILWDSFTHPQGWMVKHLIILNLPVFAIGTHSIQIHEILQYGSAFIGSALMFYWYMEWYKNEKPVVVPANLIIPTQTKIIIFTVMVFMALTIAIVSGLANISVLQPLLIQLYWFIQKVFIVGVASFVSELFLFSFYWYFRMSNAA